MKLAPLLPHRFEWLASLVAAVLLLLAFPNFDVAVLAWFALVPLFITIARRPERTSSLFLGWLAGFVFYYTSCYWLTYSMIHYGQVPAPLAYVLLLAPALVMGFFTGITTLLIAIAIKRWNHRALLLAPFIWISIDWLRLEITGQLWNAIGYSQAFLFSGVLIRSAKWGGVYAVSALIVTVNAALAVALLKRRKVDLALAAAVLALVAVVIYASQYRARSEVSRMFPSPPSLYVIAIQPNVPMTIVKSLDELKILRERHLAMSTTALQSLPNDNVPRLVIWPESPMNFSYSTDSELKSVLAKFTQDNHTFLLLNSLEPAPDDGSYNSAILLNEEGRLISQYDKIRLMPFGEYVPLPQWLPGASLITGLVGEFTPGDKYTLMNIGDHRAGVFICIESAYPWIAQRMTKAGADALINISNDGYLGPTAVMRQHLANTIFRAVENERQLLRVTNTGLSAEISIDGVVQDQTKGYQPEVRIWTAGGTAGHHTFYTQHGDLFVHLCAVLSIVALLATFYRRRGVAVT